jgi:hypothetical protein
LSESSSAAQPENLRLLKNLKDCEYYESEYPGRSVNRSGEFQASAAGGSLESNTPWRKTTATNLEHWKS